MRTKGSKDLKPRYRRTPREIQEEKEQRIRDKERQCIEEKYYLLPKELLDLSGTSFESLKLIIKKIVVDRVERIIYEQSDINR